MSDFIVTENGMQEIMHNLLNTPMDGSHLITITKMKNRRTTLQNRSLHLYLTMMSEAMNGAGIDQILMMQKFKNGFTLPNTPGSMKVLFQRIAAVMHGEERTSKLSTKEIQDVYQAFDTGMSQKFGIGFPWPSDEPPMLEEHDIRPGA